MPHIHDGFALGIILSGSESFTYRRHYHVALAGDIVLINPGEVHTGEAANQQGWSYRMFYPDTTLLQEAATQLADRPQAIPLFPQAVVRDPDLTQRLLHLHRVLEDQDSNSLARESMLLWTMAQLVARYGANKVTMPNAGSEHRAVQQVRSHLQTYYAQNITLNDLASLVHLSPFHLLRVFRNAVGLPPHAYLTQVRIRQARHLLRTGLSIATVAAHTGFTDQSHLTRHFKRIVGVTPGQYRISVR